jgi:asparagine synthase (glutamine-hydrolysing)
MCGIAGLFALRPEGLPANARQSVDAALAALAHRGPDDCRVYEGRGAILGHRRLAILDPQGGLQPFASRLDASVIAYNGELYGFDAVRARLSEQAPFSTRSDTEVVLRQLIAHGDAGLDELNGMYAFAFVDAAHSELTLAIDPVGIKPLYLAERVGWIAFASELEAMHVMLRTLGEAPALSAAAVANFLARGWVDAPRCMLAGVTKLRAGEVVGVRRDGSISRRVRPLPAPDAEIAGLPDDEIPRRAHTVLTAAVHDQLIADVPVGLFLSGGLDSSLLLALASGQQPDLRTFSVGFRELEKDVHLYDETDRARRIAAHFSAHHHELQLTGAMVMERLDEIVLSVDEPLADPASIPLFFLSEFASRHVKAALTGDGGDELFGGYQHHRVRQVKGVLHGMPGFLRTPAVASVLLAARAADAIGGSAARIGAGLRLVADAQITPSLFERGAAERALGDHWSSIDPGVLSWADSDAVFLADMSGPLAGGMLQKTDRVTMRHSIEARVPLLDDRVLRLGRALPWRWKVRNGTTKYLLRQLLAERVPPEIARAPKRGFRVPLGHWFRGPLQSWADERLGDRSALAASPLGPMTRELLREHQGGLRDHGQRLWALAILDVWLRRTNGRIETP